MKNSKLIFTMMRLIRFEIAKKRDENVRFELSDADMKRLFRVSKAHDIAHLIGFALEENNLLVNKNQITNDFRTASMMAISRYEQLNYELERICKVFEEEKIPFVPLKGAALWDIYPEPWMRTCCDIDILIHEHDLKRAIAELNGKLSYKTDGRGPHDVGLLSPFGQRLELHYNLVEDYYIGEASRPLENVWEHVIAVPDSVQYRMPDEIFYYYHIAHMAKHYIGGGCGIRPFIDLWILNHCVPYDEEKRSDFIRENGLSAFERAARNLSDVWFSDGQHDELTEMMQDYVVAGGVYGNAENRVASRRQNKVGKFRYMLSRVFLPYSLLKEQYPILKKCKLLLPIMEVRRWFRLIFKGRVPYAVQEIKASQLLSDEKRLTTGKMMEQLGLKIHN